MQKYFIIASGIKSTKTRKRLVKTLRGFFGESEVLENGDVWTVDMDYHFTPADALSNVLKALTSFTPDHLSNLTWTVTTVVPSETEKDYYRRKIITLTRNGVQDVLVELEPGVWYYEDRPEKPSNLPNATSLETERELVLA